MRRRTVFALLGLLLPLPVFAADGDCPSGGPQDGAGQLTQQVQSIGAAVGPARDVATADRDFLDQWGWTPFNHVAGAPDGYLDCGPTSGVIALALLGLEKPPGPDGAEQAIVAMRARMRPGSTTSSGTPPASLMLGLTALGAVAASMPATLPAVEAALGAGKIPILAGDPRNAWGQAMRNQGQYLGSWAAGAPDWGHWIVVAGKTPAGAYIVADPLSTIGAFPATAAQLVQFLTDGRTGNWTAAVSVDRHPLRPPRLP